MRPFGPRGNVCVQIRGLLGSVPLATSHPFLNPLRKMDPIKFGHLSLDISAISPRTVAHAATRLDTGRDFYTHAPLAAPGCAAAGTADYFLPRVPADGQRPLLCRGYFGCCRERQVFAGPPTCAPPCI